MSGGGIGAKRMTVAPGLNNSLGGLKGLNFNKSGVSKNDSMNNSIPKQEQSEKSSIGGKLEKLDIKPKQEDEPM